MIEATQNTQTVDQRVEEIYQKEHHIEDTKGFIFSSPRPVEQSNSLKSTNSDRKFIKDKHNMFKTKSTFNREKFEYNASYDGIGSYDNHEFLKTVENNQSPIEPFQNKQRPDLLKVAISNGQNINHLQ